MKHPEETLCVYWDSSAILSALLKERHTVQALRWLGAPGIHLISSLAYAEVSSILYRQRKEGVLDDVFLHAAFKNLHESHWGSINSTPAREDMEYLASLHLLRGDDLWHLAMARTLSMELPGLHLLTFDKKLLAAAVAEGMGMPD